MLQRCIIRRGPPPLKFLPSLFTAAGRAAAKAPKRHVKTPAAAIRSVKKTIAPLKMTLAKAAAPKKKVVVKAVRVNPQAAAQIAVKKPVAARKAVMPKSVASMGPPQLASLPDASSVFGTTLTWETSAPRPTRTPPKAPAHKAAAASRVVMMKKAPRFAVKKQPTRAPAQTASIKAIQTTPKPKKVQEIALDFDKIATMVSEAKAAVKRIVPEKAVIVRDRPVKLDFAQIAAMRIKMEKRLAAEQPIVVKKTATVPTRPAKMTASTRKVEPKAKAAPLASKAATQVKNVAAEVVKVAEAPKAIVPHQEAAWVPVATRLKQQHAKDLADKPSRKVSSYSVFVQEADRDVRIAKLPLHIRFQVLSMLWNKHKMRLAAQASAFAPPAHTATTTTTTPTMSVSVSPPPNPNVLLLTA